MHLYKKFSARHYVVLTGGGRDFAKRKQSDAEFAGNSLLRMVIIDTVINTLLGGLTLDPAGMIVLHGMMLLFLDVVAFNPVHCSHYL